MKHIFLYFSLFRFYSFLSLSFPGFYFPSSFSVFLCISTTFSFSFCPFPCLSSTFFVFYLTYLTFFNYPLSVFYLPSTVCLSSIIFPLLFYLSFPICFIISIIIHLTFSVFSIFQFLVCLFFLFFCYIFLSLFFFGLCSFPYLL